MSKKDSAAATLPDAGESAPAQPAAPPPPPPTPERWKRETRTPNHIHAAASALHWWKEHKHHAAGPIELSLEDYKGAVAAATASKRKLEPHGPALSPFARIRKG